MSDNQFNALLIVIGSGLSLIAAALRWSVGIVTRSLERNTLAMMANTQSNAVLSTKIDGVASYVDRRSKLPSDAAQLIRDQVEKEISGVHAVDPRIVAIPEPEATRTNVRTNPQGVPIGGYRPPNRPGTKGDR
jgi:hypothetical protein